jgi:hypothetical protein
VKPLLLPVARLSLRATYSPLRSLGGFDRQLVCRRPFARNMT